jgi:hypothetical protein
VTWQSFSVCPQSVCPFSVAKHIERSGWTMPVFKLRQPEVRFWVPGPQDDEQVDHVPNAHT